MRRKLEMSERYVLARRQREVGRFRDDIGDGGPLNKTNVITQRTATMEVC